jgi:hypothetical protein
LSKIDEIKDPKNIPKVLAPYQAEIDKVEANLLIEGKKLEHANREQPQWQYYYEVRKVELYSLIKYLETDLSRLRGKLFRSYTENHSMDLTDRAKDKFIDNEPTYLAKYEIYLEVKEVHEKFAAICDAFQTRGYALNNISKVRVAERFDDII